jgi:hypothetical protein
VPVQWEALNMSKVRNLAPWEIKAYPTFRLYTKPKEFVEYEEKELSEESIRAWLVEQNVVGITKKEEKKDAPVFEGPEEAKAEPVNSAERERIANEIAKTEAKAAEEKKALEAKNNSEEVQAEEEKIAEAKA